MTVALRCLLFVAALTVASSAAAQDSTASTCLQVTASGDHASMDHAAHMAALQACEKAKSTLPTQAGQPVFAAIAEIVTLLDANPTTDWSKVNIEALRQHLLDMDNVVMRSTVASHPIAGGFTADVTGTGATIGSIQRMVVDHARMMNQTPTYTTMTELLPTGVRLTVTAKDSANAKAVARLRGLGVAGFLTEGSHHVRHHLALARGEMTAHRH